MDTRRAVTRILSINALALVLALIAQFVLWLAGDGAHSPMMGVYALMAGALLALCVFCMWYAPRNSDTALLVYGWSAFAIIVLMVLVDGLYCPDTLPALVYAPIVGVVAIGSLIGFKPMALYAAAHIVFALVAGAHYDKATEAGPIVIICIAAASVGIAITERFDSLEVRLLKLEKILNVFSDAKTKIRGKRNRQHCRQVYDRRPRRATSNRGYFRISQRGHDSRNGVDFRGAQAGRATKDGGCTGRDKGRNGRNARGC